MSNPNQFLQTPTGEFQAHFGGLPGSADAVAECKKWEKLCAELIADRQELRAELARTQTERDQYLKTVYHFMGKDLAPPPYTKEEMLAFVGQAAPLEEFIAELGRNDDEGGA